MLPFIHADRNEIDPEVDVIPLGMAHRLAVVDVGIVEHGCGKEPMRVSYMTYGSVYS